MLLRGSQSRDYLTTINGVIVTLLTGSISLYLVLFTTSNIQLAPITVIMYSCVAVLILLNWRVNATIRKAVVYCGAVTALTLIIGIYNYVYLDKYLFIMIMLLFTITTISAIGISDKFMNIIPFMALILILTFFSQSFGYYDTFFNTLSPAGSSGLNSPNGMGLIVLTCFMIFDRSKLIRNVPVRIIIFPMVIISLLNYGSRAALICLALYLILITTKQIKHMRIRKTLFVIVVLVGLVFPPLYAYTYSNTNSVESSAQLLGKDVYSGRQEIWSEVLQDKQSIFTGTQSTELLESFPSESLHNIYMELSYKLGYPFLLLFLLIIYFCIIKNKQIHSKTYAAIITIFIYSYFESTFVTGNLNSMLMTLAFINYTQDPKPIQKIGLYE